MYSLYFQEINVKNFHSNSNKINWCNDYKRVTINQFRRIIDKAVSKINHDQQEKSLCSCRRGHRLAKYLIIATIAFVYALLPSILRLLFNDNLNNCDSFMPSRMRWIWFLCVLSNGTLVYVCIGVCIVTTQQAFSILLNYMHYITVILNKRRRIGIGIGNGKMKNNNINIVNFLPYLPLTYKSNLIAWLQLRIFVYSLVISSMINAEIWMLSMIVAEFSLFIVFIIVLLTNISQTLNDNMNLFDAFFSDSNEICLLYLILLDIIYVFCVLYIATQFEKLHLEQIQQLTAQSMEYVHVEMVNYNYNTMQIDIDIDGKESEQENNKMKLNHVPFLFALKYVETHDITPKLLGVPMDKVFLRTIITLFVSSLVSIVVAYIESN